MRKARLVLVAAVALLAGCSSSADSTEPNASPTSTVDPRSSEPPTKRGPLPTTVFASL
ncbi:hypothetical protein BDB13_3459 [Rhodococcus sp. OK302]|nr:hypothetical protein BDB13_3459 [Rhodococcus sp. OK302]